MQKIVEKTDGQKNCIFRQFWRCLSLRRRFSAFFGLKTGSRRLLFRCFFENGDFVKIVLPLWWEHNFEGSDPPKIDPESDSERHRREKSTKIASGAVSGRTFSLPGPFFVDFGVPAGSQNRPKTGPEAGISQFRGHIFRFLVLPSLRQAPGPLPEAPGTLPSTISEGFSDNLRHVPHGSCVCCRAPPGCCRDTPPTSGTHSPGCLWGTAISRSDLNSPYPNGVLAWF